MHGGHGYASRQRRRHSHKRGGGGGNTSPILLVSTGGCVIPCTYFYVRGRHTASNNPFKIFFLMERKYYNFKLYSLLKMQTLVCGFIKHKSKRICVYSVEILLTTGPYMNQPTRLTAS